MNINRARIIRELFGRRILNKQSTPTAIAALIPNCVAIPVNDNCESSVLLLVVVLLLMWMKFSASERKEKENKEQKQGVLLL